MRSLHLASLVLGFALAGCDLPPPRLSVPSENGGQAEKAKSPILDSSASLARVRKSTRETSNKTVYHGKTPEQWGEILKDGDMNKAYKAARALKIMGAEGRPYLFEGLESSHPECRRLALESLSVSDLRSHGEDGRRMLIKLAGDRSDMRIRERATHYLAQWNNAIPAR
jgi:hypothetical protein